MRRVAPRLAAALLLAPLFLLPAPGTAQEPDTGRVNRRLAWPLADVIVSASERYGVSVWASPNLGVRQDNSAVRTIDLSVRPEVALQWVEVAAALRDAASDRAPVLRAADSTSYLAVARPPKPAARSRPFRVILRDDATNAGWHTDVTEVQFTELLTVVRLAARTSGYEPVFSPSSRPSHDGECGLDEPAQVKYQPSPRYVRPGGGRTHGRVILQYVVGRDGRAEPASIRAILSDGDALLEEARRVILGSRFEPGQSCGAAVRQLVRQSIGFKPR